MKKQALLFFALSICAFGQGVRWDIPPILNSRAVLVPNANISLCPGTATITNSTCSPASTQAFTDITLTTACPAGSPVVLPQTNVCSGVADAIGNAGFWLAPGAYIYCINGPTITGKCYNLTVPAGTSPSGGILAPSINNVVYCDLQTGADIGAKCNAAYTAGNCATLRCTIRISAPGPNAVTINLPTGSFQLPVYTYTTDMVFPTPVTLECSEDVWLNYTGTGHAVTEGQAGLTINTRLPQPYKIAGCGFTGGALMTAGIYHFDFVIKSYIQNVSMINFGNTTASNIFFQSQNWYSNMSNVFMWSEATGPCYNGITVNDVSAGGVYDNGDSFVRFLGVHLQNLNNACTSTNGINVNSFNADFDQTDVLGGFANLVRLRKGANSATFKKFYGEVINNGCGILYGDLSTDPSPSVSNFIDALTIKDNSYINVHNTDFATTAHPVCPATATSGLQNTLLDNLSVSNITSGQPVVQMNNITSQTGNCANFTRYDSTSNIGSPFGVALGSKLHTTGGNITQWCGTDEGMTAYSYLNVNGINASNNSITANNGQDAQNNIVLQAGATADQDENFIFNSHTGGINGRINFATSARMNLFVGAVNAFQLTSSGVLPQLPIQSAGVVAGLTGTGACATITTTAGGSFAGTGKCTGTTGASTLTITFTLTATNGYVCDVWDETNRANVFQQTSHSPTTCVLTVTSVTQNDVFVFKAIGF